MWKKQRNTEKEWNEIWNENQIKRAKEGNKVINGPLTR